MNKFTDFKEFGELFFGVHWVKVTYPDGSILMTEGTLDPEVGEQEPGCIWSTEKNKLVRIPDGMDSIELGQERFPLEEVDEFVNRFI